MTWAGFITIQGSIFGQVGRSFAIEFFANSPGDPQGKKFLGTLTVTIQATSAGVTKKTQNFTVSVAALGVSSDDLITATATDPDGNTSEFSLGQAITRPRT
jgi:hypothetical protein